MYAQNLITMDEEETGTNIIHKLGDRKIMLIDKDKVQKSGSCLREHGASNLRFISENTTIPVPKVHHVQFENGKVQHIIMDDMPGKPLDQTWSQMRDEDKKYVADQLPWIYIAAPPRRQLKSEYIGGADHGKALIGGRVTYGDGPFNNEQSFNEFLFSKILNVPKLLRHYGTSEFRKDHEIIFTHADLAPRNILVDDEYRVTALLDWENGGWYPEYWECIRALRDWNALPGWSDYLAIILPPRFEKEFLAWHI